MVQQWRVYFEFLTSVFLFVRYGGIEDSERMLTAPRCRDLCIIWDQDYVSVRPTRGG